MKKSIVIFAATLCAMAMSSCTNTSENAMKPMHDLEWFTAYDDAKEGMDGYTLLSERESEGAVTQHMQDYEDVELFDYTCDLTLCFTDSGLIGFNYHDIDRNQDYRDWYSTLELTYGLPTEESSGMASWYNNPAGKDTAIYLFNLEEGVQVSIYATADSPDKSYDRKGEVKVPTPEIRTPIVPVESVTTIYKVNDQNTDDKSIDENGNAETTTRVYRVGEANVIGTDFAGNYIVAVTDPVGEAVTDQAGATMTTVISAETAAVDKDGKPLITDKPSTTTAAIVTAVSQRTEKTTEPPVDHTKSFLVNGLSFYGSPATERRKMSSFSQLSEYRTEEPGQPWELIMEYENVPYEGWNCDAVLCFTSLGLVGVNYFDTNASDYHYWVKKLTSFYGSPSETQFDYTAWSRSPVGSGTMIYVFALEDGVQISFFADDTGSEIS